MHNPNKRIVDLVAGLDKLGACPALVDVAQTLSSAGLTATDVADFVRANKVSYSRIPVVVRDRYELLVMTWLPGQASDPHDHAGAVCAMQVVQGTAVEGCYSVADDGYVDLEYETTVSCGEVSAGQDSAVHTVRNPHGSDQPLVTVHIYTPPLRDVRRFKPRPATSSSPRILSKRVPTIAIVGGGFSGTMTAAQLMRRAGRSGTALRVALVERRGTVGEGLAYGAREPMHLLNVPAGRMSAWPDQADDFVKWASQRHGEIRPEDFLPRQWYGEYVRESLLAAAHAARTHADLSVVLDEVRRINRHPGGGWMIHLARGGSLRADAVVLAIGHRPPSDPIGKAWAGPRTRFLADPWRPFAMNVVANDDAVVILGSGLTAVDAVLSLAAARQGGPITLVSRHGLLPQAHAAGPVTPANLHDLVLEGIKAPGGVRARAILGKLRQLAATAADWRSVVDGLRPHTQALWQAMSSLERQRFLQHLRPYWEIHRHRMAGAVAARFHAMLERGAVSVLAGRVTKVEADEGGVRLIVAEKHGGARALRADWVINCTGPMPSNRAESNPAIGSLLIDGWVRPDEFALGIETTPHGTAVAADGMEVPDLFLVGTLRKPALWESTAVPELRQQAAGVAEAVVNLAFERQRQEASRIRSVAA